MPDNNGGVIKSGDDKLQTESHLAGSSGVIAADHIATQSVAGRPIEEQKRLSPPEDIENEASKEEEMICTQYEAHKLVFLPQFSAGTLLYLLFLLLFKSSHSIKLLAHLTSYCFYG